MTVSTKKYAARIADQYWLSHPPSHRLLASESGDFLLLACEANAAQALLQGQVFLFEACFTWTLCEPLVAFSSPGYLVLRLVSVDQKR